MILSHHFTVRALCHVDTDVKTGTDRELLRKKGGSGGRQQRKRRVGELQGENCRSGIMEDYRAGAGAWCGGARES